MIKTSIIGNTGFIGGSLARQRCFSHSYNSKNIFEIEFMNVYEDDNESKDQKMKQKMKKILYIEG
jgi:hypothetical protein